MNVFLKIGSGKALPVAALLLGVAAGSAQAARVSNPVAVFSGLDKITGRITTFDAYVGETVQFGALQVTPKACYTRDESEAQRIDSFLEVDEITLDRKIKRIFNGWMFADSPALNAIEHPIFDVWLKDCKQTSDIPPPKDLKIPPSEPKSAPKPAPDAQAEAQTPPGDPSLDPSIDPNTDDADQQALPDLPMETITTDKPIGNEPDQGTAPDAGNQVDPAFNQPLQADPAVGDQFPPADPNDPFSQQQQDPNFPPKPSGRKKPLLVPDQGGFQ